MNGTYKHYKGQLYEVVNVCMHSETREKMVLYYPLYDCPELVEEYGDKPMFVRPYNMFMETVNVGGETVPRFKKVS